MTEGEKWGKKEGEGGGGEGGHTTPQRRHGDVPEAPHWFSGSLGPQFQTLLAHEAGVLEILSAQFPDCLAFEGERGSTAGVGHWRRLG